MRALARLCLCLFWVAAVAAADPVPPPSATPVEVVVSGRTSTLRSLNVVDCDQTIPPTFAGSRPRNCAGYRWFVSQHFALQTDYPAERAKHLLTVLELAFPHYREFFGRDLPGLDHQRLPTVYGKSRDSLLACMKAWGLGGFDAGGITVYGTNTTFNWPSGTLEYHQRQIAIHEAVHQYEMILHGQRCPGPKWHIEGIAEYLSHHVWDPAAQRLTVAVVDKPTINNYYDQALVAAAVPGANWTARRLATMQIEGRPAGFLLTTFFATDPDRAQLLRIFTSELIATDDARLTPAWCWQLLQHLYGGADKLDADFAAWLAQRRSSFHYVDWGWEQDAETLMSYGYPQKGKHSQTTLNFAPGDRPAVDSLVLDYPALVPLSPLVGPIARGVAEPSVGATISFRHNPAKGEAGLGLGVEGQWQYKVLLKASKQLLLDGYDLRAPSKEFDLPADLVAGAAAHASTFGLTVKLAAKELQATVRAEAADGAGLKEFTAALPIDEAQRRRLLGRPLAVLSKDDRQYITPFLDVPRAVEPDLNVAAPANRWRNPADRELECVARAAWRCGGRPPAALTALGATLRDGRLAAPFYEARGSLAAQLPPAAAAELYGLSLNFTLTAQPEHTVELSSLVTQSLTQAANGKLTVELSPVGAEGATQRLEQSVALAAAGSQAFAPRMTHPASWRGLRAQATLALTVDGRPVTLTAERLVAPPIEAWWVLGPFDGSADVDTRLEPEDEPLPNFAKEYEGKGGLAVRWQQVTRPATDSLGKPWLLDLGSVCGQQDDAAAYCFTWLDAPADQRAVLRLGSDDGAVVWLNGQRVHTALLRRGCEAYSDTIPLRLKAGRNALLVKVTQGSADWTLTARVDGAVAHN